MLFELRCIMSHHRTTHVFRDKRIAEEEIRVVYTLRDVQPRTDSPKPRPSSQTQLVRESPSPCPFFLSLICIC